MDQNLSPAVSRGAVNGGGGSRCYKCDNFLISDFCWREVGLAKQDNVNINFYVRA